MVRRRVAALIGVALVIVIALLVNGCLKSKAHSALETYAQHVGLLVKESDEQVGHPLFAALASASGQTPLNVELHIDEYRQQAETQANNAKALSVPSNMQGAQRDFLLSMDLRVEGLRKVASLVRSALGGQDASASTQIAGAMEIFLASDVIYSQRVVPLVSQTLAENSITGQDPPPTGFLPNLGWLEAAAVKQRLTGETTTENGSVPPGNYGHRLVGASVGTLKLEPESAGTLNHVKAGSTPTLTAEVENSGEHIEHGVKVDVKITTGGQTKTESHTINTTEPGKTVNVAIPLEGIALGKASKLEVNIEKVPGENDLENNKGTYLVIFE